MLAVLQHCIALWANSSQQTSVWCFNVNGILLLAFVEQVSAAGLFMKGFHDAALTDP